MGTSSILYVKFQSKIFQYTIWPNSDLFLEQLFQFIQSNLNENNHFDNPNIMRMLSSIQEREYVDEKLFFGYDIRNFEQLFSYGYYFDQTGIYRQYNYCIDFDNELVLYSQNTFQYACPFQYLSQDFFEFVDCQENFDCYNDYLSEYDLLSADHLFKEYYVYNYCPYSLDNNYDYNECIKNSIYNFSN